MTVGSLGISAAALFKDFALQRPRRPVGVGIKHHELGRVPPAFRVAGCGFGAVLMKTQVLRDVMIGNRGRCFIPEPMLGEDLAFCQRAAGAGHEIWCEPTARVGHIGSIPIWPEDGPRFRGEIHGLEGKKLN